MDRGALYTHNWVENRLLRLRVKNAEAINPEMQHLDVGDQIWFVAGGYPSPRFHPYVADIEPNRHLVCTLGDASHVPARHNSSPGLKAT